VANGPNIFQMHLVEQIEPMDTEQKGQSKTTPRFDVGRVNFDACITWKTGLLCYVTALHLLLRKVTLKSVPVIETAQ